MKRKILSRALYVLAFAFLFDLIVGPFANPAASEKVTIYGAFPCDKGYKLNVFHSAHTTSRLAAFVCGGFGTVTDFRGFGCRGGARFVKVKQIGCCNYEMEIFRDYYFSGVVGWIRGPLFYSVLPADAVPKLRGLGFPSGYEKVECEVPNKSATNLYGLYCHDAGSRSNELDDPKVSRFRLDFMILDNGNK